MKLSTAIREGSKHGPMCQNRFFDGLGGCDALGAAYGAATGEWVRKEYTSIRGNIVAQFPVLAEPPPDSMAMIGIETLYDVVITMTDNGYHPHTREEIADLLEAEGL